MRVKEDKTKLSKVETYKREFFFFNVKIFFDHCLQLVELQLPYISPHFMQGRKAAAIG